MRKGSGAMAPRSARPLNKGPVCLAKQSASGNTVVEGQTACTGVGLCEHIQSGGACKSTTLLASRDSPIPQFGYLRQQFGFLL